MRKEAVIAMVFLAYGLTQSFAQVSYNASPNEVTSKLIGCIQNSNYDRAVGLFHFPPSYSKKELTDDIKGITAAFKLIERELGKVISIKPLKESMLYYDVSIEGGNISYWQQYPQSLKFEYEVEYEKERKGILAVEACNIKSSWEIRKVHYGIDANSIGSKERIFEIMEKLMEVMGSLSEQNNVNKI